MRLSRTGFGLTAAAAAGATVLALMPGAQAVTPAQHATSHQNTALSVQVAKKGDLTSHVRGTFGQSGTVRGTFRPERFFVKKHELRAAGTLHAVLRRGNGTLVGKTNRYVVLPVHNNANASKGALAAATTCSILHLVLGPLDLTLLGLNVHLNQVVLDITATPGAGNLLGNLLCAVAGLLDGTTTLSQLLHAANLLNQILTILHL